MHKVVLHSVLSMNVWYTFPLQDADSLLDNDVALKGTFHFWWFWDVHEALTGGWGFDLAMVVVMILDVVFVMVLAAIDPLGDATHGRCWWWLWGSLGLGVDDGLDGQWILWSIVGSIKLFTCDWACVRAHWHKVWENKWIVTSKNSTMHRQCQNQLWLNLFCLKTFASSPTMSRSDQLLADNVIIFVEGFFDMSPNQIFFTLSQLLVHILWGWHRDIHD